MIYNQLIMDEMDKRNEIINTFNKNYLLEAGAGAGKTTLIVQRIINHITKSNIDPSSLVAITFTKAASTELAERIQNKALETIKEEKDPVIISRLKSVDKIFTGTIHSFCDVILREMPFDANLTPGYEIIEDTEEFLNNIWYNFLRENQIEYKEITDALLFFNINYLKLKTKTFLALENPDIKFGGYEPVDYSYEDIEKRFEDLKREYSHLSSDYIKNSSTLQKMIKSMLDEDRDYNYYLCKGFLKEFEKWEHIVETLYDNIILKKHLDNSNSHEYEELISGLYDIYLNSVKLAYNLTVEFMDMVVDYKDKYYNGKLTFNELLYKASKLIKESSLARTHFKNKYRYFYVDEFQDTDPMQAELILHLTDTEVGSSEVKEWHNCSPLPGSLFVVGDPKQSIYRFRRADILTYNQVKEMIKGNGEVAYLDINFRSSDNICNWVQTCFKKTEEENFGFMEDSTDVQAGFTKILSLWDDVEKELEDKQLQGVYLYEYPEKEDQEYIAAMVEDILNNFYITEKIRIDKDNIVDGEKDYYNNIKKVEEKDILILTKANIETGLYLKALKDRGIPALLSGEKVLGHTREVMNLFILIDAIIDYRDKIKIVSALRNSFYLDLDSIDLFMEDNKDLSSFMFSKDKLEKIQHPNLKVAFRTINEIIRLSREMGPIAFVERIIENRIGVYNTIKDYNPIELRDANSALRQTVEMLKSKRCSSIYEIREELKKLIENKVSYELPISRDEAKDAVRIMNVHKAKGLEANIVILAGAYKKRGSISSTHYVEKSDNNENIGYIAHNKEFGILGPNEMENKRREEEFLQAEIDRLLYVAATRAKTALIVANSTDEKGFLFPLSRKINRIFDRQIEIVSGKKSIEVPKEKINELEFTKLARLRKELFEPSYLKRNPSQFQSMDVKYFNNYLFAIKGKRYRKLAYEPIKDDKKMNMGPRGNIYGTIVHRAMEVLINKSNNLKNADQDIIEYASKLSIKEELDKLEINKTSLNLFYPYGSDKPREILDLKLKTGNIAAKNMLKQELFIYLSTILNNFIENEDIRNLFYNAKNVFTELPFSIALSPNDGEVFSQISKLIENNNKTKPILINGTIDLFIKHKDGSFTILDYKSDNLLKRDISSKLRELYSSQIFGYKILVEEILKEQDLIVDNLLIYSTYIDKLIKL